MVDFALIPLPSPAMAANLRALNAASRLRRGCVSHSSHTALGGSPFGVSIETKVPDESGQAAAFESEVGPQRRRGGCAF